jgi:hypothetical protein
MIQEKGMILISAAFLKLGGGGMTVTISVWWSFSLVYLHSLARGLFCWHGAFLFYFILFYFILAHFGGLI